MLIVNNAATTTISIFIFTDSRIVSKKILPGEDSASIKVSTEELAWLFEIQNTQAFYIPILTPIGGRFRWVKLSQ